MHANEKKDRKKKLFQNQFIDTNYSVNQVEQKVVKSIR